MSRHIIPIDASNFPDLLKIAEEVNATKTPRLIKRNGETLGHHPELCVQVSGK